MGIWDQHIKSRGGYERRHELEDPLSELRAI